MGSLMKRFILLSLIISSSANILAANLYRYIDESGTVVLDRTIPPELVSNGYVILNEQGTVLKIVSPALTEEEKAAARAEQQRVAIQEARDKELLKLYRSPDDVDRAMLAWTSRLDVEISLKKNQMAIKRSELADIQSEAADLERVGKPVTPEILARIAVVQAEIETINSDIEQVKKRRQEDIFMFELDKIRVTELTQ